MTDGKPTGRLGAALARGMGRAALLRDYCFGIRPSEPGIAWDPAFPHHNAPRYCSWCGERYRRHAGFVDHGDRCDPHILTRGDGL